MKVSPGPDNRLDTSHYAIQGADTKPERRNQTGFLITYGDAVKYATSMMQKLIPLSGTEAGQLTLQKAFKATAWLRRLLFESESLLRPTEIYQNIFVANKCANESVSKHLTVGKNRFALPIREGRLEQDRNINNFCDDEEDKV